MIIALFIIAHVWLGDYTGVLVLWLLTIFLSEIKLIEDVLKMVEETDAGKELELDPFLEYSNWKSYEKRATDDMEAYNGKLKTVMETYGIKSEAELISGCIVEMRSRITDKVCFPCF